MILDLITGSEELTVDEYSERMLGGFRFIYYFYLNAYHVRPSDLDDLVDGLCFLDVKQYTEEQHWKKMQRSKDKK